MLAKALDSHTDKFMPHLDSILIDIECHCSKRDAVISNIGCPTRKLTKTDSRQPVRKIDKSISLITCIVDLFTPLDASVRGPCACTMPTTIVASAKKRTCVFIRKDEFYFHVALKWVSYFARLVQRPNDDGTITSAVILK